MCTIAFREADIFEVIKIAGDTGFSGIELWGREGHSGVAGHRVPAIKKACEKRGLEINSFGSYLNLSSQNFHAEMEEILDICRLLTPGILRVWAGDKSSKDTSEEEYAGILANGKILAERLKETCIIAAPIIVDQSIFQFCFWHDLCTNLSINLFYVKVYPVHLPQTGLA